MKIKFKYIVIISFIIAIIVPGYFVIQDIVREDFHHLQLISKAIGVLYSFVVSVSICGINLQIAYFLQHKIPWQKNFFRRLTIELVITNITASIIICCWAMIFRFVLPNFQSELKIEDVLFSNIIVAIIVNTIAILIVEGVYMVKQWKNAIVEAEILKRESIESQFAALKNQIDPHFLFNSLNALDSLISQSPKKAKEFVSKFSKVYRYVLDVKDKLVIEIKEELEFIKSYYFLQKIRHNENLTLSINVEAEKLNYFIPALSIQMLVENAIKHNEISSKYPLHIEIFSDKGYLVVSNILRPKKGKVEKSTGIGIQNLKERYKHFSSRGPLFTVDNEKYIAKLPILKEE